MARFKIGPIRNPPRSLSTCPPETLVSISPCVPRLNEINDTKNLPTCSAKHEKQTIPQTAGLKPARERRIRKKRLSLGFFPSGLGDGSDLTTTCGLESASHGIGKPKAPGSPKWERLLFRGIGTRLGSWEPGWYGAELSRDRSQVTATLLCQCTVHGASSATRVNLWPPPVAGAMVYAVVESRVCGRQQVSKQAKQQRKKVVC